jgi:bacteriocin biosynthesis cyclodehydratase domain-containing protein
MKDIPLRPCLAPGFTVLSGPDRVRLVAGEDFRYTLTGRGLESWLPQWLPLLDGSRTAEELASLLPDEHREAARQLLARLYGERVLIDPPAAAACKPASYTLRPEGTGALADALRGVAGTPDLRPLRVLAQDRLDYDEVLRFNRDCLRGETPWLWVTCGPQGRGYLSPAFLPDAGPCLACLLGHFERLSPAPEIYADLAEHARQGKPIAAAPFPERGARLLVDLLLWKAELLEKEDPPAALFRLHVLDVASLEVTAHRVFIDTECSECHGCR